MQVVLARLKSIPVRLENGGKTIKVPAEKVDELRINGLLDFQRAGELGLSFSTGPISARASSPNR
jgi:hypothetical protein